MAHSARLPTSAAPFWRAALLTLVMPGLGHVYAGRVRAGLSVWLATLSAFLGALMLWARGLFVPWGPVLVLLAALLLLQGALLLDLWRGGRTLAVRRAPPLANRALTCAGLLLGLGVLPVTLAVQGLTTWRIGSVAVAGESMFPVLLAGDRVLFDRAAYRRRPPDAGELVVLDGEAGSRVARVVATGGHTVQLRGGRPVVDGTPLPRQPLEDLRVPRFGDGPEARRLADADAWAEQSGGTLYLTTYRAAPAVVADPAPVTLGPAELFVLGDHRAPGEPEEGLGRVPVAAVAGRPAYVWLSVGPTGLRAGRIGLPLE